MFEYAVVGSGIGGSTIAAYLNAKQKDVVLFEKEGYLGGCSSTFKHKGRLYNTGATTFAGYQNGFLVKELFDTIGFTPQLIPTDPTIVVKQGNKIIPRFRDFEKFLASVQENYPHEKNRDFWELIYKLNNQFYRYESHYYSNKNIVSKIKSLLSFVPLGVKFWSYLARDAQSFIEEFFGEIDTEYMQFLESQILIVAQAPTKEINFLTAALSLAYTFNENYYVYGGFSKLFDGLTQNISHLKRSSEVLLIQKEEDYFSIHTKKETIQAKKVILNSTVYDSAKLFEDESIRKYYKKYEKLNNYQSSFMLYMTLKTDKSFEHHYQLIQDQEIAFTKSNAIFVSFSDKNDNEIAPQGHYSVTVSIHTDTRFWNDPAQYESQKRKLHEILLDTILSELHIEKSEVVESFAATPKSFMHYLNREQLGGNAITFKNFLPFLPSNDTRIKGLYGVGDTTYAAQGWPGVMMGVKNLTRLLDV